MTNDALTALGDATRQDIVNRLAGGRSLAVAELADELPVSRPAVSQHLKVLKQARLVVDHAVGTRRYYRLDADGFAALRAELDRFWTTALAGCKETAENHDPGSAMPMHTSETAVRHSIVVDVPIERAFAVYVAQEFANPEHHLRDAPMEELVLEPYVGGRWFERSVDGGECNWGRVLAYEPPHRLVLSWQISPTFSFEPDPAKASEVEVRFVAESGQRTRVELEHRSLELHGAGWEQLRDGVGGPDAWPDDLQRFAAAAAA